MTFLLLLLSYFVTKFVTLKKNVVSLTNNKFALSLEEYNFTLSLRNLLCLSDEN